MGWVGMEGKGSGKKTGITISMYNEGWHDDSCATQTRQVVIEQHHTTLMDADSNGLGGGNSLCGCNMVIGMPSKQFSSRNSSLMMQKQN